MVFEAGSRPLVWAAIATFFTELLFCYGASTVIPYLSREYGVIASGNPTELSATDRLHRSHGETPQAANQHPIRANSGLTVTVLYKGCLD